MTSRSASHAGSWYSSSRSALSNSLDGWLSKAAEAGLEKDSKIRAIIAPHAGYSYSGETAAWAYGAVDTTAIEKVFILGPSHHYYLRGCALTKCATYETPLGDLKVDQDVVQELKAKGSFEMMDLKVDEEEHSIEMHLPYVRKIFGTQPITIIPILVGSLTPTLEATYGSILSPYLTSPKSLFIISSDFCHWGSRFQYTFYLPSPSSQGYNLSRNSKHLPRPIWESIEELDHLGMKKIGLCGVGGDGKAHEEFGGYLKETKNTICGRHPIGVLLAAIENGHGGEEEGREVEMEWKKYAQSSRVIEIGGKEDSSVSYASGVFRFL